MKVPARLKNFPEWHEGDGFTPFHFGNMPAGNQCAWTCTWVSGVEIDPKFPQKYAGRSTSFEEWLNSPLTDAEALCELRDVSCRVEMGVFAPMAGQLIELRNSTTNYDWRQRVDVFLPKVRELYSEFVYSPSPPAELHVSKFRPGWNKLFGIKNIP